MDCHAVVTHLSNVARRCIIRYTGFRKYLKRSLASDSGMMSNIENPAYPDRDIWINSSIPTIQNGGLKVEMFGKSEKDGQKVN